MTSPRRASRCWRGWRRRRAIRRYTPDPIPDADLAEILWHAQRAPSGTNRQPFRFVRCGATTPSAAPARTLLTDAVPRAGGSAKRADLDRDGAPDEGRPGPGCRRRCSTTSTTSTPCPVVVLVGLERYRPPDPAEGASVYPACQNLLLAARALGYGGAMTGWHPPSNGSSASCSGSPTAWRCRRASRSACRPGATARCAASRCGRSSTTACGVARPSWLGEHAERDGV